MFIKNIKSIKMPKNVISVDYDTKEYLQRRGFLPIGYNDRQWIFNLTETLSNILQELAKGGGQGADNKK